MLPFSGGCTASQITTAKNMLIIFCKLYVLSSGKVPFTQKKELCSFHYPVYRWEFVDSSCLDPYKHLSWTHWGCIHNDTQKKQGCQLDIPNFHLEMLCKLHHHFLGVAELHNLLQKKNMLIIFCKLYLKLYDVGVEISRKYPLDRNKNNVFFWLPWSHVEISCAELK